VLDLRISTPAAWVEAVLGDFDSFLIDHAACERKAAATGMAFVVRYPDRAEILDPLIAFAREELEHFHQVFALIQKRGLSLTPDVPDPYVTELQAWVRGGRDERLLDRLVLAGVVEARGCERFGLVAEAVEDVELRAFYSELTRSEARHAGLFPRLARIYFDEPSISERVDSLLELEAGVVETLEIRPALH
jgi:tRNA-(ms[2]io[6]A)-hydroxylase